MSVVTDVCGYTLTAVWAPALADDFQDLWRNQLWQWIEDGCSKPMLPSFFGVRLPDSQALSVYACSFSGWKLTERGNTVPDKTADHNYARVSRPERDT